MSILQCAGVSVAVSGMDMLIAVAVFCIWCCRLPFLAAFVCASMDTLDPAAQALHMLYLLVMVHHCRILLLATCRTLTASIALDTCWHGVPRRLNWKSKGSDAKLHLRILLWSAILSKVLPICC